MAVKNNRSGPVIHRGLPVPRSAAAKQAQDFYWGIPPTQVVSWKERDIPDHELIEIGKLHELHVDDGGGKAVLKLPAVYRELCHLAYDPKMPHQRMHLLTVPAVRALAVRAYDPHNATLLPNLAKQVGGVQAKDGRYPVIKVTPLGELTDIVYRQRKKGDDCDIVKGKVVGPGSAYIHALSEDDNGPFPVLCVDALGRFWLAGGSYKVTDRGIEN